MNYAGLALIALGLTMMVAEMLVPSGALGIGGIIAFVVGSVMLMDTEAPGFGISWQVIGGMALTAALALLMLMMTMLARSHKPDRYQRSGGDGRQRAAGSWTGAPRRRPDPASTARPGPRADPPALAPGRDVRITAIEGLTVEVEPEP